MSLGAYLIPGSDTPAMGNLTLHVNMQSFPALLAVKSDTVAGAEHWALWDGHCVRDPSWRAPDTNRISEYEVLEVWPLVYHIRPAWLDKLDAKDHSLKALHEAIRKRD